MPCGKTQYLPILIDISSGVVRKRILERRPNYITIYVYWMFYIIYIVVMADITMCQNKTCPMKDKCYRQKAKESEYQSYASFDWKIWDEDWTPWCEYFYKLEN